MRRQVQHRVAAQPGGEQDEAGSDRRQQLGQRPKLREAVDIVASDRGYRVETLQHALRHDALSVDGRREKPHEQHLAALRLCGVAPTRLSPPLGQYGPGGTRFRYSPLIVHVRLTFTAGIYWRLNVRWKTWFPLPSGVIKKRCRREGAACRSRESWSAEPLGRP